MYQDNKIWIGKAGDKKVCIEPSMANRHGLIAGATGTGKTITLKVMAESFSDCGVPVFLADVKGDLAGMCKPGEETEDMAKRMDKFGLREAGFSLHKYPTTFWDIYGENGIPLRSTISEMGPLLLSRILDLNQIQSDILTIIFKIADDEGLMLLDTKDLKAMIQYVGDHAKEYTLEYGNITKQSLGAIVRAVVALESEGGEMFFGEPALSITDWFTTGEMGRGMIHVLDCQKLINKPTMYATFMLWMMSELFETLPEMGDMDKPRMVFFFDEAHMLFDNAPKALLDKIEQVVKLIRSKGVGIYFITQNPQDIPDGVLAQLGNKVQHALRAYTPSEQKKVKAAAQSYRENPAFDTFDTILELGVGEALISVLDKKGVPTMVENCKVLPPQSQMGAIDDATRKMAVQGNMLYVRYAEMMDRESAYEILVRKGEEAEKAEAERKRLIEEEKAAAKAEKEREKAELAAEKQRQKELERAEKERIKAEEKAEKERIKAEEKKQKEMKSAVNSVGNTVSGTIGREVGNALGGAFGSFGKKVGGNLGASLGRGLFSTLLKWK
ncbi:MAG: DUF853 family protein [Lachnospiraceae bacterium]|nr:DUF853 family protein [Lachnospiraceae bacterium]